MKTSPSFRILAIPRAARICLAALFVPLLGARATAATYAEQGDAGDSILTAQAATGPAGTSLTAITGKLTLKNGISEADLYEIYISNPSTFSASTTAFVSGANDFDTQLFLFTTTGVGIVVNDDAPSGGELSDIPAGNAYTSALAPGLYDLLITGSGEYPANVSGNAIFPNFTDAAMDDPSGVYGPTGPGGPGPLAGYTGNSNEGGKYSIALTGAQFVPAVVPEPSIFGLSLFGLAGAGLWSLRRRTGLVARAK